MVDQNPVTNLAVMIADDPELDLCLRYMMLRDTVEHGVRLTKKDIAYKLGMSETTLWRHMRGWYASGVWETARQQYLIPKGMEVATALYSAIDAWPELLAKVINNARTGDSNIHTFEVMKWMHANLVMPQMAEKPKPSPEELEYVNSDQDFDPTSV